MIYYIDSGLGNDLNSGTISTAPWKTITKVNSTTLHPGDSVLFNCGQIYPGTLSITASGISGSNITFGQYGTGSKPIISAFKTLNGTGWVNAGGGIFTYTDATLPATIGLLTFNGLLQPVARFPRTGYRAITAVSGSTSITDSTLPNLPSYADGQVVIKTLHYSMDRLKISSQSGGIITYTGGTQTPPVGNGYFVQNSVSCLTQLGDWCYNSSTHTISMFFGSNIPSSYVVKASANSFNVDLSLTRRNAFVTINGLAFEGSSSHSIRASANFFNITNCTINNSGEDGIFNPSTTNVLIDSCSISNTMNNGITLPHNSNTTVSNNILNNIGIVQGAGENGLGTTGWGTYTGIIVGNQTTGTFNNLIQYNNLTNIGYNGIRASGDTFVVDSNFVSNATSILDDGGGIYTWQGATTSPVYTSRTISNNIVINCTGNAAGNADNTILSTGIYCDDNTYTVTISGNTVVGNGWCGIFIHNSHTINVTGNTIYNNAQQAQIYSKYDNLFTTLLPPTGLNISNNKIISGTSQSLIYIDSRNSTHSSSSDITTWGTASNNSYGSTNSNTLLFKTNVLGTLNTINFSSWKTATGQDSTSTIHFPTYLAIRFDYNNTKSSTTIPLVGSWVDIVSNLFTTSETLTPFTSNVLFQTVGTTTTTTTTSTTTSTTTPPTTTTTTSTTSTTTTPVPTTTTSTTSTTTTPAPTTTTTTTTSTTSTTTTGSGTTTSTSTTTSTTTPAPTTTTTTSTTTTTTTLRIRFKKKIVLV